jgi:hypothetical protein
MKPATKPSLHNFAVVLALGAALLTAGVAPAAAPSRSAARRTVEGFDIAKEPTPSDWRFFIKAKEASREKLWTYNTRRGKQLGDWAWGWRLGWVRVCAQSDRPYCAAVLEAALVDKALVVRAEAATRIGRRFEGTGDAHAAALLESAFADRRNVRGGKPMFVQARILFALHGIGGEAPRAAGRRLAASHPTLTAYWAKLEADHGD